MNDAKKNLVQVKCPACGYRMPLYYEKKAESKGIHVTCKGRNCKRRFELRIENGKQIK